MSAKKILKKIRVLELQREWALDEDFDTDEILAEELSKEIVQLRNKLADLQNLTFPF